MNDRRPIIYWLCLCCALIFTTALVGAITRLTESGLSITEWRPVSGVLPPLNDAQWSRAFDLYRASPEFVAKHSWMQLQDFKRIFFWEWLHRVIDRLIGVAYAAGLIWFAVRRQIPQGYGWRLCGILVLGCLEGPLGWWMVSSGLVHRPSVSHFLLAAHLGLALTVFSAIWWTILDLTSPSPFRGEDQGEGNQEARAKLAQNIKYLSADARTLFPSPYPLPERERVLAKHGIAALLLLVTTIIWGAFTAGLKAGLIYNTFPLMGGHGMPTQAFDILHEPAWVQFTHRWLAITTGLTIFSFGWRRRDVALMAMVCVQIALGISTLLSVLWLPLAVLHQAGAIILLALTLRALHRLRAGSV